MAIRAWLISSTVGFSIFTTSVTLILLDKEKVYTWFKGRYAAAWFVGYSVIGEGFLTWVKVQWLATAVFHEDQDPTPRQLQIEQTWALVKDSVEFIVSSFLLVYGIRHPLSAKGIQNGLVLAIGGSASVLASSLMGLSFVRNKSNGFSMFSTTFFQVLIFVATDEIWFMSGFNMAVYSLPAFVYHYNIIVAWSKKDNHSAMGSMFIFFGLAVSTGLILIGVFWSADDKPLDSPPPSSRSGC